MASSSDVRDVLELPKNAAPRPPPAKKFKPEPKKLDGLQRELYSLLGENTPPIAVDTKKFKDKPNWRQKATPWVWANFKPGGRDDDLTLGHWVRGVAHAEDEEHAFSKFNVKIDVPELDEADYKAYRKAGWTFDETKYLFDLCRQYDIRWLIIHDRYDYPDSKRKEQEEKEKEQFKDEEEQESVKMETKKEDEDVEMEDTDSAKEKEKDKAKDTEEKEKKKKEQDPTGRGLEDLKERFYDVYRALFKVRQEKGEELSPQEEDLVKQMNFSKEAEKKRKEHLERLLSRSPAEVAEEEALVMESRKLEAAAERMMNERQELLRLLDAPTSSSSITQYQTSQGLSQLTNNLLSDKSKRRKEVAPSGVSSGPLGNSANVQKVAQAGNNKKAMSPGAAAVAATLQKKLSAKEEAAYGISYHEKLSSGVHFRSNKISTAKPTIQSKVNAVLTELALPARPIMPTARVCAKFESIQQSIGVLLEAKKQADKLDAEIKVLRGEK
ncbi:hypothetical protein TRICI_004726 [Trichomonascus ciferrii]|uniref:SWR1-complex protein 4 n=1 Tax=Trichomonascus ciferrii TaxID=44093 RepID=A0A642V094_9ASCO|nr:hypothetical protein TRICI_004726 [Trichomonascus ciferrii]